MLVPMGEHAVDRVAHLVPSAKGGRSRWGSDCLASTTSFRVGRGRGGSDTHAAVVHV